MDHARNARSSMLLRGWLLGLVYVAAGLGVVVALCVATGGDVPTVLSGWFVGAFGNDYNLVQTLLYATPLTLIAIGVAPALQAGVVTVGAEGQMIFGAILATMMALWVFPGAPLWLGLPLGAAAGLLGGALWGIVPAIARTRWAVNEILFTLMANYLAIFLLKFLLRTALRDPAGSATPQSAELPHGFQLPQLPLPGRLHDGAILVLLLVVFASWWSRTRNAFLIEVAGTRPQLAARAGMSRVRAVIATMTVSGAAAGLAGWMQLAGVDGRLQPGLASGIGFSGIAVAVLGGGHPLGILAAAIVYASLTTGANGIEFATGSTPAAVGTVGQGVLLLATALAVAAAHHGGRRGASSRARRAA